MKDLHVQLGKRYDALNLRERLLIAGTLLTITWAVWIGSFGGRVMDTKAVVVTDLHRVEAELTAQQDERKRLLSNGPSPRLNELGQERAKLIRELEMTEAELDEALAGFVAPEEVAGLLEDVVETHDKLALLRITTQPAESLKSTAESAITVYRHPVQVEVKGSYLALIAYLEDLESSGWGLSWRRIEYVVDDYPQAQVLLEVETLSREKEWLGV